MSDSAVSVVLPAQARPRLWEVDAVRGAAVVLMILFHLMWDLSFFGLTRVNVFSPSWQAFARGIGSTFIFVMGVSLTLDAARNSADARTLWRRNLKRGAMIFGFGMLVSLVTFVVVGDEFVRFGILHLAGASIILASLFVRLKPLVNVIAGLFVIVAGAFLATLRASFPWLIPFGVVQSGISMVDYWPLAPWFGVALLGIAAGKWLYPNGSRCFAFPDLGSLAPARLLRFLGRHSLVVYLIHQPILIAILYSLITLRLIG